MTNIKPALSFDPLRHRRDDEPWIDWASELYAHTLAELMMDYQSWQTHFGFRHPGPGYTATLKAQELRLSLEIKKASDVTAKGAA